ncbi:hypothetical protein N7517_010553 [Penicillium concentricum]|uniref:Uncharacterized protein n=1 Tax=Penicillium concentricum TaxID=293559 RepID=A0A9W9UTF7_9EURO|nr:uncharacterized protein N7517_010553 [Penicillium concentricum]KAJ5355944.1 hypothetical protein N7517_010553 [Penicillium concentricum]
MEEIFQSSTTKKIQELLVYCGIGDCSDEPIKQHILGICDFDTPSPKKKEKSKGKAKDGAFLKDISQGANDAVSSSGDEPGDKPIDSPLSKENTMMNPPQARTPSIEVSTPRYEETHHSIVENILINCGKLNDPLGRYRHRSKQAYIITRVGEVQSFVDDMVKLQYPDAVQLIKQENALSASQGIQSRFNETVHSEIIKGITLRHEKLLTHLEARTIVAEFMIRTGLLGQFQGLDPIALGAEEIKKNDPLRQCDGRRVVVLL